MQHRDFCEAADQPDIVSALAFETGLECVEYLAVAHEANVILATEDEKYGAVWNVEAGVEVPVGGAKASEAIGVSPGNVHEE